jgi:hypothetical protein
MRTDKLRGQRHDDLLISRGECQENRQRFAPNFRSGPLLRKNSAELDGRSLMGGGEDQIDCLSERQN